MEVREKVVYRFLVAKGKPLKCPECKGTGKIRVKGKTYACEKCRGTGTIPGDSVGGGQSVKRR